MKLLTKEQPESYENVIICHICQKSEKRYVINWKHCKVRHHCHYTEQYRGSAHSIHNSKYSVPKKIISAFPNGSSYDYHFIIKKVSWRI